MIWYFLLGISQILIDDLLKLGAGSVLQHIVAQDGKTHPPLFRAAMTSSTFLPSQYQYNDTVPEVIFCLSTKLHLLTKLSQTLYSEVVAQTKYECRSVYLYSVADSDVLFFFEVAPPQMIPLRVSVARTLTFFKSQTLI